MKLTDMFISSILKKGMLYETRNLDTIIDVPIEQDGKEKTIKIQIKADHVSIKIEKE